MLLEKLQEMWSIPGLIGLSVHQEQRACRHMWKLRTGAMRSMRCYVAPRKLCGLGYSQVLQLRREAHYMLGLQETTATCGTTTTSTGTRGKEQAKGSRVHEMWNIPGHISLSVDKAKSARRRMWKLRTGAMRSMRCYVVPWKLCGLGYSQLLQHRWREAHYMLGLQRTTATCATTTATGTHEKDKAKGLHVQAPASTHTDMPTPR